MEHLSLWYEQLCFLSDLTRVSSNRCMNLSLAPLSRCRDTGGVVRGQLRGCRHYLVLLDPVCLVDISVLFLYSKQLTRHAREPIRRRVRSPRAIYLSCCCACMLLLHGRVLLMALQHTVISPITSTRGRYQLTKK